MRNLGSIGISARIGIAFALALPITFWALGSNTFEALDNYRRADMITRQNTAANALIAGVYEILIERQHVNNSLQADGPATPDNFRDIERHRTVARTKINAAYADLLKQDFPNKAAVVAEFKTALEKAEEYRRRSDEAIRLPKAQRDPEVVKSSYAVLSAFVVTAPEALEQRAAQHQPARHRTRPACEYPGHLVEHARYGGPRARDHIAGDVIQVSPHGDQPGVHQHHPGAGRTVLGVVADQSARQRAPVTGEGPAIHQGRLFRQVPAACRQNARGVGNRPISDDTAGMGRHIDPSARHDPGRDGRREPCERGAHRGIPGGSDAQPHCQYRIAAARCAAADRSYRICRSHHSAADAGA